jgi:AcrR family transcriptional regulator
MRRRVQRSEKTATSAYIADPRFKVGGEIVGPVTPAPVRYNKSEAVQKKLLDTAEYLFARWGYAAISIRDVTSLAKMRVANVSYYFGSKQNLYYEVLRRRSEPLAQMRLERIKAARSLKANRNSKLEALVAAYADPPLELSQSGDPGWKNFFSLIAQVTFSGFAAPQIFDFFNEPARQLMEGLHDLYPSAPSAKIQAAALLLIGPYIMVIAETGRIETFFDRTFSSSDLALLGPLMKQFIAGGIRGILESPVKKERQRVKKGRALSTRDAESVAQKSR